MNDNAIIPNNDTVSPGMKALALLLAMCRTWIGATILVSFGMAYFHYGSSWTIFNLLVFAVLTGFGVKALYRRVKAAKGRKTAVIVSFLAVFGIWNLLDGMNAGIRPSHTIDRLFDIYPMRPFHALVNFTTGIRLDIFRN